MEYQFFASEYTTIMAVIIVVYSGAKTGTPIVSTLFFLKTLWFDFI
jgi:hypothetical protein